MLRYSGYVIGSDILVEYHYKSHVVSHRLGQAVCSHSYHSGYTQDHKHKRH